ncbi:MAG: SH3 domain-containing protein [Treponema sp.]|nr:SH3 domain-containing protein [Treponema sp.]
MNKTGSQQSLPAKKSKKKPIIICIIILIILGGLGGAGYYFYRQGKTFDDLKALFVKDKSVKKVSYTTYNWNALNLRAAPDGKVIRAINKDSILNVEEELDSGWLKVKVADSEGYVATQYTKDEDGYFRGSYKTKNLTKHGKDLISKYFTSDEQKILKEYEFRYMPDWIADIGGGKNYALTGIYSKEPKVIYLRDSSFKTPSDHDDVILHELCHAITPEQWGVNSPFANRLKVAGYEAGLKKVRVHLSEDNYTVVSTGK